MTLVIKKEIVINNEFGGFGIDKEIADWLVDNKNWKIVDHSSFLVNRKTIYCCDFGYDIDFHENSTKRTDEDLVECVKILQKKYLEDGIKDVFDWNKKRKNIDVPKVLELKVKEITIEIDVEDRYDGKECVNTNVYIN